MSVTLPEFLFPLDEPDPVIEAPGFIGFIPPPGFIGLMDPPIATNSDRRKFSGTVHHFHSR